MARTKRACSVGKVAELVGDHCSLLIVRDLLEGPKRFGELEASLRSSSRTLAKKLKLLERERMVIRKETEDEPSCVRYALTKKGAALGPVVEAMRAYGARYLR